MVDYNPFGGNYTGVIVRNNTIRGGFATTPEQPGQTKGDNNETVIIKSIQTSSSIFLNLLD